MNQIAKLLFFFGLLTGLTSCFKKEVFPDEPRIEFHSLNYIDTERVDSLILRFSFEDGGGNIGFFNQMVDVFPPYHIYSFIVDSRDTLVKISSKDLIPPYYRAPVVFGSDANGKTVPFYVSEVAVFSQDDLRPVYNCIFYEIIEGDTIFVARNEFYHNFHIDFLKKRNGKYSPIDFAGIFGNSDCNLRSFNGRIPFFDPDARKGTFTYSMLSQGFRLALQTDTVRLRFYVYDRLLNKSNVVESPDFLLNNLN